MNRKGLGEDGEADATGRLGMTAREKVEDGE